MAPTNIPDLKANLANLVRWFSSASSLVNRPDRILALKRRADQIPERVQELERAYQGILASTQDPKIVESVNSDYDYVMSAVDEISEAVSRLDLTTPPTSTGLAEPISTERLPPLGVPHFDGSLDAWTNFITLFDSIVHRRKDLSEAQKLGYLFISLGGEPLTLIKHLDLSDPNYKIARDLLFRRYQNIRRIADLHVAAILNIPRLTSLNKLRTDLLNPVLVATNALKGMGFPVTEWSFILLHIVLNKLPNDVRARFEQLHGGNAATDVPTFDVLVNFLEGESRHFENVPAEPSPVPTRLRSVPLDSHPSRGFKGARGAPSFSRPHRVMSVERAEGCRVCRGANHPVLNCDQFRRDGLSRRRFLARRLGLCYYCLGTHRADQCSNPVPCSVCGGSHHPVLCVTERDRDSSAQQRNRNHNDTRHNIGTMSRTGGGSPHDQAVCTPSPRALVRQRSSPPRRNVRWANDRPGSTSPTPSAPAQVSIAERADRVPYRWPEPPIAEHPRLDRTFRNRRWAGDQVPPVAYTH